MAWQSPEPLAKKPIQPYKQDKGILLNVNDRGYTAPRWPAFTITLTLLAIAIKALIPAGFMPTVTAGGMTEIVICSGLGEKTISIPADGDTSNQHDKSQDPPCAYHLAALNKILISAAPSLPVPLPVFGAKQVLHTSHSLHSTRTDAFSARGPPSFSA